MKALLGFITLMFVCLLLILDNFLSGQYQAGAVLMTVPVMACVTLSISILSEVR